MENTELTDYQKNIRFMQDFNKEIQDKSSQLEGFNKSVFASDIDLNSDWDATVSKINAKNPNYSPEALQRFRQIYKSAMQTIGSEYATQGDKNAAYASLGDIPSEVFEELHKQNAYEQAYNTNAIGEIGLTPELIDEDGNRVPLKDLEYDTVDADSLPTALRPVAFPLNSFISTLRSSDSLLSNTGGALLEGTINLASAATNGFLDTLNSLTPGDMTKWSAIDKHRTNIEASLESRAQELLQLPENDMEMVNRVLQEDVSGSNYYSADVAAWLQKPENREKVKSVREWNNLQTELKNTNEMLDFGFTAPTPQSADRYVNNVIWDEISQEWDEGHELYAIWDTLVGAKRAIFSIAGSGMLDILNTSANSLGELYGSATAGSVALGPLGAGIGIARKLGKVASKVMPKGVSPKLFSTIESAAKEQLMHRMTRQGFSFMQMYRGTVHEAYANEDLESNLWSHNNWANIGLFAAALADFAGDRIAAKASHIFADKYLRSLFTKNNGFLARKVVAEALANEGALTQPGLFGALKRSAIGRFFNDSDLGRISKNIIRETLLDMTGEAFAGTMEQLIQDFALHGVSVKDTAANAIISAFCIPGTMPFNMEMRAIESTRLAPLVNGMMKSQYTNMDMAKSFHDAYMSDAGPEQVAPAEINYDTYSSDENKRKQSQNQASELSTAYERNRPNSDSKTTANGIINDLQKSLDERAKKTETEPSSIKGRTLPRGAEKAINEYVRDRNKLEKEYENRATDQSYQDRLDRLNKKAVSQMYGNYFSDKKTDTPEVADRIDVSEERKTQLNKQWTNLAHASDYESSEGVSISSNEHQLTTAYADKRLQLEKTRNELRRELKKNPGNTELEERLSEITQEINKLDAQYPDSGIKRSVRAFLEKNAAELHEVNPTMSTEYSSRVSGNKSLELEKDYRDFAKAHNLDQVDRFSTAFQSALISDIQMGNAESAARARRLLKDLYDEYNNSLDKAIKDRKDFLAENTTRNSKGELVPKRNAAWKDAVNVVTDALGGEDVFKENLTSSQLKQMQEEIRKFQNSKAELKARYDSISELKVNATEVADAIDAKVETDLGLSTDEEVADLVKGAEVANVTGGTIDAQVDETDLDIPAGSDDMEETDISATPENPTPEVTPPARTEPETESGADDIPDVEGIDADIINDELENQKSAPESESGEKTTPEEATEQVTQDLLEKEAENREEEETIETTEDAETAETGETEPEELAAQINTLIDELVKIYNENERTPTAESEDLRNRIEATVRNLNDNPSNFENTVLLDRLIALASTYYIVFEGNPVIDAINDAIYRFPLIPNIEKLEARLTKHPVEDENDVRNYYHTGYRQYTSYAEYYSFLQWVDKKYTGVSNLDVDLNAEYKNYYALYLLGSETSNSDTSDIRERYQDIQNQVYGRDIDTYVGHTNIEAVNAGMQKLHDANYAKFIYHISNYIQHFTKSLPFYIETSDVIKSWVTQAFIRNLWKDYKEYATRGIIEISYEEGTDFSFASLDAKFDKFLKGTLQIVNADGRLPSDLIDVWARNKNTGLNLQDDLLTRILAIVPFTPSNKKTKQYKEAKSTSRLNQEDLDKYVTTATDAFAVLYSIDPKKNEEFTESEAELDTDIRGNSPEAQQLATRGATNVGRGDDYKGQKNSITPMLRDCYGRLLAAVRLGNARTMNEAWSSIALLIVNQARKAFHGKIVGSVNQEMYQQLYQDLDTCLTFITNVHTNPKFAEVREAMLRPEFKGLQAWLASIKTLRSTILELNALAKHFPPGMSLEEVASRVAENPITIEIRTLDGKEVKGTKTYSSPDQILRLKNIVFPRSALNSALQTAEVFTCIPLDYATSQMLYTKMTPDGKYDNTTPRPYVLYLSYPLGNDPTSAVPVPGDDTGDISFCFRSDNWIKKITQENVETTSVRKMESQGQRNALGPLYAEAHEHLQRALQNAPVITFDDAKNLGQKDFILYPDDSNIQDATVPVTFRGTTSDVHWYNAISPDCELGSDASGNLIWQFNGFTLKHPHAIEIAAENKSNKVNRVFITSSPYMEDKKSFWDFLGLRAILRGTSPQKIEKQSLAAKSIAFTYLALIKNNFIPKGFINSNVQVSDKFSIGKECWQQVSEDEAKQFWTTTAPEPIRKLFQIWQANVNKYIIEVNTRVHRPSTATTGMTTLHNGSVTIPRPASQATQPKPWLRTKDNKDFSNLQIHSGGALGADSIWSRIAEGVGVPRGNIHHYTTKRRPTGRLQEEGKYWDRQRAEQGTGTTEDVQGELQDLRNAMLGNKNLEGKIFPGERTLQDVLNSDKDGLQTRNYKQVIKSDQVFAVAPLNPNHKHVAGGTGTAVAMAIALGKPVYVLDTSSDPLQWYSYDINQKQFVPIPSNTVAIPTRGNVALIGSRSITSHAYKNNKGEWNTTTAHKNEEQIRAMMADAFGVIGIIRDSIAPDEQTPENTPADNTAIEKSLQPETPSEVKPEQMSEAAEMPAGGNDDGEEEVATPESQSAPVKAAPVINPQAEEKGNLIRSLSAKWQPKQQPTLSQKQVQITNASEASPIPVTPSINPSAIGNTSDTTEVQSSDEGSGGVLVSRAEVYKPNVNEESLKQANITFSTIVFIRDNSKVLIGRMQEKQRGKNPEETTKELLRRFAAWALVNVGAVAKTFNTDGSIDWAATTEVAKENEHFESTLNMLTKILAPCNLLTKKSTEAEIQEATDMCVNNINLHSSFLELFSILRENMDGGTFGPKLQSCLPSTQFKNEPLRQVLMEALNKFGKVLNDDEATRNSIFDKICITGLDFLCSKYLYKGVRKGTRLNWESPIVKSLLIGITDDAEVEANLQYIRENNPPEVVNDLAAAFCVQSTFANALGDALYQALNFDQYLGNQNYTNEKKSYLKGVLGEIATVIMCDSGFLTLKTRRVKMLDEIKTVSMITGRGQEEVDIEVNAQGIETPKQVTLDTLREFSRLATTSDVQDLYSTEARNENVVKTSPDDVHPDVSMNNHKPVNDKNSEMIKETAQTPFKIPNYYVDMFSRLLKMSRGGVSLFQYLTSEFQKGNSLDFSADGWLMKNFKTAMEVLGITAIDGLDGETKNAVQIQNEKHLNVILTVVNKHKEFQSRKKDIKDIDPNEDGLLFWTTYSMGNNSRFTLMGSDLNPQADKEFTRQFCFSTKGEVPVKLNAKHKVGNQEFSEHQVLAFGILQNLDKKPEKKVKVSNWTTEARKPIMVALRGAFATKGARNIVSRFKAYNDARKALEDAGYPFEHPVAILNTMQTMEQFLEGITNKEELDKYIEKLENAESTEKFYEILENHLPQDGIYTNYMHIESDGVTNGPAIGVTYVVGMRDYLKSRFKHVPSKDSVDFLDAIGVSTNRENMYDSKDKNHPDGVVQDLYEYIKSHLPIEDMFNSLLLEKGGIAAWTFKGTGIKFIDFLVANFDANADDINKKEAEFFDSYTESAPSYADTVAFYQGLIGDILTRDLIKGPATQGSYGAMLGAITRGLLTHPIGGIFTTFKKKINSPEFKNNPKKVREAFNQFIRALVDLRGANKIYDYQDLTGHGFLEKQESENSGFSSTFTTSGENGFTNAVTVRQGIKISLFQSLEAADDRRDKKDTWLANHPNAYLNEFYLEANRDKLFHFENQVGTQQSHMADPILALLMYQNSYAKPHGNEKAFDDFDILLRAANFRANDWFNDPEYRKEFCENYKSLLTDICYELNYSVFIEEARQIRDKMPDAISGNIEEKAKVFAEKRRNDGSPAKSVAIPGHALMENLTRLCISKIKASEEYAHKDTPDKVIKVFHDKNFGDDYINAMNLLYSPEGEGFGLLPSVNIKNTVHLPNGKEFITNLTNSVRTGKNQNTSTLGEYIFTEVFNSFNRKGSDYRTQHFHKDTLRNNQEIAQIYCDMESTFHEYSWYTPTATVEDANLKKLNEAEKANSFFIHGMPDDIARAMTGGNRDGRSYTSSNNTYQKMPCPLNVWCDGISFKNDFGETNVDLVVQSGRETPNVRLAKIKGIPVLNLNAQIRQVSIDGVPTYFEVNASNEDVFAKYGSQNDKVARIGDFIGAVANHIRNNRPKDGSYYMDTLMRMYAKDPDYFYTCMFRCAGARGDLIGDGTGVLAKFMQDNVDRTVLYTKVMAKPKQVTNDFKEGKYDNGRTFTVDKLGRLSELVTPAFKDTMGSAVFSAIMDPMGGNRAMTQMSIAALPYYARICVHLLEIANSEDYVVQPTDTPQIAEIKKKYAEFIDTMVKRLMGGGLLKVGSGEFLPVMESSNENDIENKIIVQDNKNISHFNSGKIALMIAIGIKMMVQSVHSQDSGIASFTGKTTGRGYLNIHDALEGLCNAGFFKGNLQQNIAFLNACLNPDAENNPDFNYVNFFSNVDGMYSVFDKLGSLGDIIPARITSAADASKMFNAVMDSDLRHSINMSKICKGFISWNRKTKQVEISIGYREGESEEERAIRIAKFNEMLDQLDTLAGIAHEFSGIYAGAEEKAWQDTVDEAFQGLQSYRDFRIHKDFSFNDTRGLMFYAMKRALAHLLFQGAKDKYADLGMKGGHSLDDIIKDIENSEHGIEDFIVKGVDPKKYTEIFLNGVRHFANPYALVDSKYAEDASNATSFSSYAVSLALNRVQLGKQGNKEVDPNYLWKVICDKHPDLVRMLYSPEVREGVLGIFRELLQGCAKAHDDAARALVSNNPKIFQYNVGFAENAEYLKNQNKIDAEEAEKAELDKHKKIDAYHAYKMAFNSQTKYAKEFYDLAGNDDVVLNCRDSNIPLSAMLETPDNPLVGLNAEDTTALLQETLENLENTPESWQDMADRFGMMQRAFTELASELLENADSLLNDPSVSKINMYNTMDKVLKTGVYLNTSKGKLFISTPVFLKAIHGGLFNKLNDWAKVNTKSALQTVYNAAADVFNAYNTLYVANGIRTREGDNFTQGVIKGNQADALAQSDQALRDAFNAIRNGQPLPNNMVREIEIATEQQLLNTYDSLSANVSMSNNTEMVGMSAEHDKTLRGRLEKLAGLFSGIKVLLGNKGTAGVAFTGGNTIAIQQGVADAMKAGIPMSTKEMFGHENCHIAFKAVDRNSKEFAQLKQAWRQARDYLATRKNLLMVHHWTAEELGSQALADQANQIEMRKAEARYDYMFGTGEAGSTANDLVEEFAVLAYTNEFVEKALKDVPFVASQGKSETSALGKLIDAIIEFVDGVFKKLTEKIKKNKIKVTPTLMTAVENVFDSLVETESRYDRIMKSEAMTRLSTKITQASNKIGEIEDVTRDHVSGWISPNKKELISRVVQTIREQGRFTRELVNETLGTNFKDPSGRSIIASFINKITVLNRTRQQNKALDAKFLTESFGNQLTKQEAKAIRDGVCILDLQCLKNIYSNDAIMELLTGSDEPVNQAVDHHKQMVRDSILAANLPEEFVNFVINCGNNLACKLATDSWSMALTHQNAAQILNAYGTDFAGVANGVPQDQALRLHQILDEYISLKAMQLYRQHADNADNMALLRELWRVEKASSKTARRSHGFNAVLNYHQATVQTSKEYIAANTINQDMGGLHQLVNVRKGYLKPQFSPYYEVVAVTTEEERTDLLHRGYKIYDGPEANLPNTISGMTIMYNTYPISSKHTSGALTTISNHAIGTNMEKEEEVRRYVGHNIGRSFGNLLIGELPVTPNKEISIELGFTDEGNVKALRFVDSRAMREKLLEEDTHFATALAATSASICEKTISAEANRQLIDTLLDIMAAEYNPAQESEWVIMAPDSENETVVQDYGNMPEDSRRYLFQRLQERGLDYLRVKKNHYNMVFGYHNASLRNLTDPSAEEDQTNKNIEERAKTVFRQVAYNLLATKFGMAGQAVLEYLVHLAKDMVVNKSFVVSYKNLKSNIQLLSMAGVNPKDALALTLQGYKHFTAYNTQIKKIRKLHDAINYGDLPEAERKIKLSELRITMQELANNPMREFMQLGGSTSIVAGEYDVNQDNEFTPLQGVMKIFDENAGTPGKRIKPILNWLLIRHGSTPYDIAQELATGTDTVAKWIYYEYLKKNEFKEDTDEARTNAFMKAQETFISFDLPTNKWVQLGNDLGFLWFTKYLFRTQRVIATQFKEKPARTLSYIFLWKVLHMPWVDGSILPSNIFNMSSTMQKIANPITRTFSSASQLPVMQLLNAI